jgi:hypothetical protein
MAISFQQFVKKKTVVSGEIPDQQAGGMAALPAGPRDTRCAAKG